MTDSDLQRSEFSTSIRHLKVFDSVGQLHGVRRASEECHLSQPAVTQAIAKLEDQMGVTLLERRASGSYLNEFGIIFHRRTQRLFAQFEQALVQLGVPSAPIPVSRIAGRISRTQIRSLISIVENGSFAQAARALNVSQTSLQRAARDLERNLRTPLYAQTASGIVATPAATEFARQVKLALREIQWGIEEVEAARGNIGGEIVIGAMLLAGSVMLASVINEFVLAYPNANVRILNGNADDMLRYLRTGDVDVVIGLLREPAPDDLVHQALAATPYVVVARHEHPLTRKANITLDDLSDYEWIIGTPRATRRIRFDKLFCGRRRPQARIATCSLPTIRLLLTQSDRLTLLTSYELIYEEDALTAVPFGPIEPVPTIGLTMRENWLPTRLQANFIDLIHSQIAGSLTLTKVLKRSAAGVQRSVQPALTK
jgi:LysR family transcriptional regulator, regulator for genes of the gallate degradation pathway